MAKINLYLGDSSDDEDVAYDKIGVFTRFTTLVPIFKVPYLLAEIAQSLLEIGVVEDKQTIKKKYKEAKAVLRTKFADKLQFDVTKGVLGTYLQYKKLIKESKPPKELEPLEKSIIAESAALVSNKSLLLDTEAEKAFFSSQVSPFINGTLIPKLSDDLCKFICSQSYNEEVWSVLKIEKLSIENLLKNVMNVGGYFNAFIKHDVAIATLMANIGSDIVVKTLTEGKRQQFKVPRDDIQVKDFIKLAIEVYVRSTYMTKGITDIYCDYTASPSVVAVPEGVLPFYATFRNADIGKIRGDYIKNQEPTKDHLYLASFVLEHISLINAEINSALILLRPKTTFVEEVPFSHHLVDFLLDHRIIRSKLKEQGIKHEQRKMVSSKQLPLDKTDEEITISVNGARTDLRFFEGVDSYEQIAQRLDKLGYSGAGLRTILLQIIHGDKEFKNNPSISHDDKVYLYKLADLLFNLEPEREVSAFLTNVMFIDLVERGIYKVTDLPDKLPMAMRDAVSTSRHIRSVLPLTKQHKFDFIDGDNFPIRIIEFCLKNLIIMSDWLNKDSKELKAALEFSLKMRDTPTEACVVGKKPKVSLPNLDAANKDKLLAMVSAYKDGRDIDDGIKAIKGGFNESSIYETLFTEAQKTAETVISRINPEVITAEILGLLNQWYDIDLPYLH